VVVPADADEDWPEGVEVEEAACQLALCKARRVAKGHAELPVLAADTVVCLAGRVFGKPASRDDARTMLLCLSGQTHDVISGVALVFGDSWTGYDRSAVTFRALSMADIDTYLDRASYEDKAGAYGIQEEGAVLVDHFQGRLDTIVGLPMSTVESLWQRMQEHHDGLC
jgi:septum formation protein